MEIHRPPEATPCKMVPTGSVGLSKEKEATETASGKSVLLDI